MQYLITPFGSGNMTSGFRFPCALNDLNSWDQSELLLMVINGLMNELDFDFILNDET